MPELFRFNKELQASVSHSTTVQSPPVLQYAVLLLLHMSDVPLLGPWGVSPHIFQTEWVECTILFPFPSQQRSVRHPKIQNNKRIVLHICHMAAPHTLGLFSVIWFGESWLSHLSLDCGYVKYACQCCAHKMWQEISQWCACVDEAVKNILSFCWWTAETVTLQLLPKLSSELDCPCRAQSHSITSHTLTALFTHPENVSTHGNISSICAHQLCSVTVKQNQCKI